MTGATAAGEKTAKKPMRTRVEEVE